jgi:hypothetical protein
LVKRERNPSNQRSIAELQARKLAAAQVGTARGRDVKKSSNGTSDFHGRSGQPTFKDTLVGGFKHGYYFP